MSFYCKTTIPQLKNQYIVLRLHVVSSFELMASKRSSHFDSDVLIVIYLSENRKSNSHNKVIFRLKNPSYLCISHKRLHNVFKEVMAR